MTENPIFILGQPRSGTTLWMRLLNAVPGVTICGEHGDYLRALSWSYFSFQATDHAFHASDQPASEFLQRLRDPHGFPAACAGVRTNEINALYREFIAKVCDPLNLGGRCGFKEIRYGYGEPMVEMLISLFPRCQIVFCARNVFDQITSVMRTGWWVKHSIRELILNWRIQFQNVSRYAAAFSENARLVHYEQPDHQAVFAWLGLPWAEAQDAILAQRTGQAQVEWKMDPNTWALILELTGQS